MEGERAKADDEGFLDQRALSTLLGTGAASSVLSSMTHHQSLPGRGSLF